MKEIDNLLERFRRGAEMIAATTSGLSAPEADFTPAPGKWTVRQIVAHLADVEVVSASWFRRVIAESEPVLARFDQDRWCAALGYCDRRIPEALDMLRMVRGANFELLKSQDDQYFRRTAHLAGATVSLLDLLRDFTGHTESHARQIEFNREKYRENRTKA
jgi:hypothetical protein